MEHDAKMLFMSLVTMLRIAPVCAVHACISKRANNKDEKRNKKDFRRDKLTYEAHTHTNTQTQTHTHTNQHTLTLIYTNADTHTDIHRHTDLPGLPKEARWIPDWMLNLCNSPFAYPENAKLPQ